MLSLLAFAVLLLLGMPVAFTMICGAVLQIVLRGNAVLLLSLPQQLHAGMESYGLLALPIFIHLGGLMSEFRLYGLTWGTAGMRQVVTSGRVETVEDLAGLRIRTVPLAPEREFWRAAGAVPTPMPLPAPYDAFANGQVDAMQIDHEGTWNSGYWRHAGTILNSGHMMFPMAAVAPGRIWQEMAEEDQAIVAQIFDERIAEMVELYGEIDAANLENLRGTGLQVLSVERDWFGPAVDSWYETWRAKASLLADLEAEAAR